MKLLFTLLLKLDIRRQLIFTFSIPTSIGFCDNHLIYLMILQSKKETIHSNKSLKCLRIRKDALGYQ